MHKQFTESDRAVLAQLLALQVAGIKGDKSNYGARNWTYPLCFLVSPSRSRWLSWKGREK